MIVRHMKTAIMHRAVEGGGLVFFGGVTAEKLTPSIAEQTRDVFRRMEQFFAEAKVTRSGVLSATVYLTDLSQKDEMNRVWIEWFGDHLPTRATVGVADLGRDILIEVALVACRD